ncbi:hypothetical protein T484DRAFT_1741134 [Baffinella frigidus]|nr:hypothetical protein T484DRAFT_1741134 [Cryptophyta sp. CCMP2293]
MAQIDALEASHDFLFPLQSSVCLRDYLPGLNDYRRKNQSSSPYLRIPTLEFKIQTVPAPDFDWLNDTEEPAARKTSIPKRSPPREETTMQGAARHSPVRNETMCEEAGGRVDRSRGGGQPGSRASATGRAWAGFEKRFNKFSSRPDRRLEPGARPTWD